MCGIVGLCLTREAVRSDHLAAMSRTVAHRGPDGGGMRHAANVGIAMRRLAIIDPEGGDQPISNESDDVHVVQNGEIYNYRELGSELVRLGHRFRSDSDTEVIVHAYEEWGGRGFAARLRGMFAIAVWDRRSRELWLARDRLGIKPLFCARSTRGFAFASEVTALLAGPVLEPRLDRQALCDYLTFGSADADGSFYEGVRPLAPGCTLRIATESAETSTHRYWQLRAPEERPAVDEATAAEALEEKLRESVRLHLAADVPVGAFLSGGVDSSAVVGLMAQEGAAPKTFSIGFDRDDYDERPFARRVAREWGCEHHEEVVTPDAVKAAEEIASHFDEPFADASAIPTWYVSRLASRHLKVVLTGDGGDELFGGYERYAVASRRMGLERVPSWLRRLGSRAARHLPSGFPGKYFLGYAALDRAGRYASEHCLFPIELQHRLLRPEQRAEQLGFEHPLARTSAFFRELRTGDYLSDCMHFDTLRYLPMDILTKVDRMTMAHGLEARPPLLDHELLELAVALPTQLKIPAHGPRKQVLRRAVSGVVPAAIMERPKAGFSVPLQGWFAGPLKSLFADTVLDRGRVSELLEVATIRTLVDENARGRRDHGLRLWAILMLELWLRRLSERRSAARA